MTHCVLVVRLTVQVLLQIAKKAKPLLTRAAQFFSVVPSRRSTSIQYGEVAFERANFAVCFCLPSGCSLSKG